MTPAFDVVNDVPAAETAQTRLEELSKGVLPSYSSTMSFSTPKWKTSTEVNALAASLLVGFAALYVNPTFTRVSATSEDPRKVQRQSLLKIGCLMAAVFVSVEVTSFVMRHNA